MSERDGLQPSGIMASLYRDGRWYCTSDVALRDDQWPTWPDWNPMPRIRILPPRIR